VHTDNSFIFAKLKYSLAFQFAVTKFLRVFPGFFLRRFRDPTQVPRISNRVPRIREIGSLRIHTGYLTFSLKKTWCFIYVVFAREFLVGVIGQVTFIQNPTLRSKTADNINLVHPTVRKHVMVDKHWYRKPF